MSPYWHLADMAFQLADVRYWHLADLAFQPADVRYWGQNGHGPDIAGCPLMTQSGHQRIGRWVFTTTRFRLLHGQKDEIPPCRVRCYEL